MTLYHLVDIMNFFNHGKIVFTVIMLTTIIYYADICPMNVSHLNQFSLQVSNSVNR